ncbi:IclR family transcriptional regulator [Paenibacillus sp. CC-CFT747]|nr:IclR family transcriptional regulator [Paenibacillus sp. CC-CFT747]
METKYRVPALDKAHAILQLVAEEPFRLKQADLSKRLQIHKSSVFSLLHTMEGLGWLERSGDATYSIGMKLGLLGQSYYRSNSLMDRFHLEAKETKQRIGETIQLAKLDGYEVLYLAKEEAPTPVQLASNPGMRFPAHATALGKCLLAFAESGELDRYRESHPQLEALTPYTVTSHAQLAEQLETVRSQRYSLDTQECVMGFICCAAPVFGSGGIVAAAVSSSMPEHVWREKRDLVIGEIAGLAERLSQ